MAFCLLAAGKILMCNSQQHATLVEGPLKVCIGQAQDVEHALTGDWPVKRDSGSAYLDKEEVRAGLHGEEAGAGHVDSHSLVEELHAQKQAARGSK